MVYLDYSATTPVNDEVIDSYSLACKKYIGNPNSLHKLGLEAKKIIDAGSLRENTIELAKMVDYVVCSHDFAEQYTKSKIDFNDMKTLIDIYDKLKREFKNNIIITLEDKGCFTYDDGYKMVPSIKVEAVDTTGAGDIYHGAFTYCVAHDYDILTTMKISNITGALSITRMGGRNSIFPLEEIMDKYNELNVQQ